MAEVMEAGIVVLSDTLHKVAVTDFTEVKSPQDVMLELRVRWQELEVCLRNRRVDGFEKIVDAIENLAAVAIRGAIFMENARLVALAKAADEEETPGHKGRKSLKQLD